VGFVGLLRVPAWVGRWVPTRSGGRVVGGGGGWFGYLVWGVGLGWVFCWGRGRGFVQRVWGRRVGPLGGSPLARVLCRGLGGGRPLFFLVGVGV